MHMTRFLSSGWKQKLGNHELFGLRWLIDGFNARDVTRIKLVGPDRAAAEWIVRCGGRVRLDAFAATWFSDWNELAHNLDDYEEKLHRQSSVADAKAHLIDVDATDSCITGYGCLYLEGLERIQSFKAASCKDFDDTGITNMADTIGKQLSRLELISCPLITDDAVEGLVKFSKLKTLVLKDLKGVEKPKSLVDAVKSVLPLCQIDYDK